MTAQIQDVLTALKELLSDIEGVQVYDYVPDAPTLPALAVYLERWPYAPTEDATFVVWCISGTVETQGAQARLMEWFSDTGPNSICALIDSDPTLTGVVSGVLPLELRQWGNDPVQEGRTRHVQGQIVLNVLR